VIRSGPVPKACGLPSTSRTSAEFPTTTRLGDTACPIRRPERACRTASQAGIGNTSSSTPTRCRSSTPSSSPASSESSPTAMKIRPRVDSDTLRVPIAETLIWRPAAPPRP